MRPDIEERSRAMQEVIISASDVIASFYRQNAAQPYRGALCR